METFDITIVGGGPAGAAAALQIRSLPGGRNVRVCLVDKATFPRPKLCGGGLTARTEELLACLGMRVTVPNVAIREIRFVTAAGTEIQNGPALFRVVRREEFDASLVLEAHARGTQLICGDPVRRLQRDGGHIQLALASGRTISTSIVIGADGANSIVRRTLVPRRVPATPFIALEVLTHGHDEEHQATFDFRPLADGVRGYAWDFPSLVDGKRMMNRGIASVGGGTQHSLRHSFRDSLLRRNIALDKDELEGSWAPIYDENCNQSAPNVVLAGDAIGIDPWLGEGISSAIGTGIVAGHAAMRALNESDFSFGDFARLISSSTVGEQFRRNQELARKVYGVGDVEGAAA